jgi:ABC-type molybdate transport system substrate-binding protein
VRFIYLYNISITSCGGFVGEAAGAAGAIGVSSTTSLLFALNDAVSRTNREHTILVLPSFSASGTTKAAAQSETHSWERL